MACGCNGPCEPAPFRCSCQSDCWTGPPEDYTTCLDACDEECDFPEYPGLPAAGYRCVGEIPEFETCDDGCFLAETDALNDCDAAYLACVGSPEACSDTACECKASAHASGSNCHYNCAIDIGMPAWMACAHAEVDADEACCDTDLGTCYQPCEQDFLDAAELIEFAWFECGKAVYNGAYGGIHACADAFDPVPGLRLCDYTRQRDLAALLATRKRCRAACEHIEIEREDLTERKRRECGGRNRECGEGCAADFLEDNAPCIYAYQLCYLACDGLSGGALMECFRGCGDTYLDCWSPHYQADVGCRLECCAQEHAFVPNGRILDRYTLDSCVPAYLDDLVVARKDFKVCRDGCGGGLGCLEDCQLAYDIAANAAKEIFDTCGAEMGYRGDCPNCVTVAFEGASLDADLSSGVLTNETVPPHIPPPAP